jgi:Transposase, Mutator family
MCSLTWPSRPQHRAKLHSTSPLERINGEIKRRTELVGIFPSEDAIVRLVGAILLEKNDECAVQRDRYMTLETIAPLSDDPAVNLPAGNRQLINTANARDCGDPPRATPPPGTRSHGFRNKLCRWTSVSAKKRLATSFITSIRACKMAMAGALRRAGGAAAGSTTRGFQWEAAPSQTMSPTIPGCSRPGWGLSADRISSAPLGSWARPRDRMQA